MNRQITLMQRSNLPELLHLSGYRVIFHETAMGMNDVRKPVWLSADGPPCRAELVVVDLTYTQVYAHGHNLKALFVLRDFGSGPTVQRRAGLPVETKLTVSTEDDKRTDEAFITDLEDAYLADLRLFASQIAPTP